MRLAWFGPLPPDRSGIAAYSAELLGPLSVRHRIDVFVERIAGGGNEAPSAQGPTSSEGSPASTASARAPEIDARVQVLNAHDFLWRHSRHPYDLIIYQLGNDLCHDYLWPYLVRHPGLVVLHDGQLHQARAKALTSQQRRPDDYRAEFTYSHPDAPEGVADLVVAGLGRTVLHLWPMLRVPVESARLVAVHNRWLAEELRGLFPDVAVSHIRMGVSDPLAAPRATPSQVRARHAIPADAVVFSAFGRVTPEKGLTPFVRALAAAASDAPGARLMLVGEPVDYYDLQAEAAALGVADRLVACGYVEDARLPEYLAAADIAVCLRWPTSRETSASWLRSVAAGTPAIVDDLAHTCDIACLDPRTMEVMQVPPGTERARDPLAMAVDLSDEHETLKKSIVRLATGSALRERLGAAARDYWRRECTLDVSVGDYESAIAAAAAAPPPRHPGWPAHLRVDGGERAREIAGQIGVAAAWL